MKRCLPVLAALCLAARPVLAQPQSDARQRQAAAEAYDQGTAAYVASDFEKAAEWFETANRLSPAAPALIQASRAHKQAGHLARAATLGLRLTLEYASDPGAKQVGQGVLDELSSRLVRVDVTCTGCTLDVDGGLQESLSFFVDPDTAHRVTASFETGDQTAEVRGAAGESRALTFEAPAPRPKPVDANGDWAGGNSQEHGHPPDASRKPLAPVYTYVGAALTAALLVASIVSTVDMNAGVAPYEKAATAYRDCVDMKGKAACSSEHDVAQEKLSAGQRTETRSTALWVATGGIAVATGVIALFLTHWSGKGTGKGSAPERALNFQLAPSPHGVDALLKGSF